MNARRASLTRETAETAIEISLDLDGSGAADVSTGIGFLDHLLTAFARHARVDLQLTCKGDLQVDDHHSAEDSGIMLGKAIDAALSDRADIARFGYAYAPLDECLARAVVDVSGRAHADINLGLQREMVGTLACENIPHVLRSLAAHAGITLHIDVLKGENDHHRAEASFKAFALALRMATHIEAEAGIPSTKGVIERGTS